MSRKLKSCIVFTLISLGAGALSSLASGAFGDTYSKLALPDFAPPGAVFPVVWTVIYILTGIGAGIAYASFSPRRARALTYYALQAAVNFMWPVIFFARGKYAAAFLWLLLLLFTVCAMTLQFAKINKTAAFLQLPYIAWVIFAGVLNLYAALMN